MPLYKSLILLILLLVSSSSILVFKYAFFLFLNYLLASRLTLFRVSTLLWLGSCIHYILACFLWSKIPKHSSSNHGLCCFISCIPRLSVAEVLIFSLMLSQGLFMSSSSLTFSKAANPFVTGDYLNIFIRNSNFMINNGTPFRIHGTLCDTVLIAAGRRMSWHSRTTLEFFIFLSGVLCCFGTSCLVSLSYMFRFLRCDYSGHSLYSLVF